MMFSAEKCSDQSTGAAEEMEVQTGGGEGLGKEGVPPDEVASAVAAVSDEIGDILKDELGDADRADRIGAELAGLSAELGLLAGLASDEPQQDFPSLFEIAMGHRMSGSGSSSSSSWSGGARRNARPQRTPRRRPIAKGKEISRRRSAAARRAASMRVRCVEVVSDASDVGDESDSEGQWTELEDVCSSDNSSSKEPQSSMDAACNGYQHEGAEAEPPAMGQFLLPLLTAYPVPERTDLFIRHEDILQAVRLGPLHLLSEAEEDTGRLDMPGHDDLDLDDADSLSEFDEEPPVTPEEEAALLHYVCEAERLATSSEEQFKPVDEWLLGVYHAWCEISALVYTLIGSNMNVEMVREDWVYRARFGCHCRLCLSLANSAEALARCLRPLLGALARGSDTIPLAVGIMRALRVADAAAACRYTGWRLPRLRRLRVHDAGQAIIHEQLLKLESENELTRDIVNKVCLCRPAKVPLRKENAMDRLCMILENFKAASSITFSVDIIPGQMCADEVWMAEWRARLSRYLAPFQRANTAARLRDMMARPAPPDLSAWTGQRHKCDCLTPRTVCAQQRKLLLRISFFGMMQAVNDFDDKPEECASAKKAPNREPVETGSRELQQGDGTGAKPPDSTEGQPASPDKEERDDERESDSKSTEDLDDLSASDGSGSLGLSSSSLDSASELLLCAAAAVESGSEDAAPGELCRTVRHLMRSIAHIERLMDRVLKHCDEWPAAAHCRRDADADDRSARKRVDMGLSEVDRKLMAMYQRLPEVHRRQLQVYRKQKKLSTVCMQLVGGRAPAPPPPGSPPPAPAPQACRALCPEYHLQRFQEVRRKVMHMRDQQLYYHRLRMWLEEQLRYERERERDSMPESNVTLVDELPRRKRRSSSPKPRVGGAPKRKLKPPSKPQRILQMLKHKTPAQTLQALKFDDEVDPPEAFPLEKDDVSDAETIVGEKEADLCKEMKECLVKFANFALNSLDNSLQQEYNIQVEELPDSVSPPLQEMSPTTSESMPVYTPKPSQRLLQVNKFLARDEVVDFQSQIIPETLNVPLNARRTPILVEEEEKCIKVEADPKDPNVYKYVTFGLEIKKAMEECQNIINSYNSINKEEGKEEQDGPLSLEQICEVMMSLDKNSAEFLEKNDTEEPIDINSANTKLVELVENMPQILANMPEIASKLSEFANASFELPEFASIMNSLPEVNNETQLTPDTLRQIRELKLTKSKDNIKVTKNTAKRKTNRRVKASVENEEIVGTVTLELDSKDIEMLNDEKDPQELVNNKSNNKENFKDLLFSISAQVVINKVFEYLKQNKSPELAKCLEEDKDFFNVSKHMNSEMYTNASTLFDNSVKDALDMDELREVVKARFISWKCYVATKFNGIPVELLDVEIEAMLEKFHNYIQDLAAKQTPSESDKMFEKIEEYQEESKSESDSENCPASKESLKQISRLLRTSAGNTFDLLLMKLSKMSQEKNCSVRSLKLNYIDVVRRCSNSMQLCGWILLNPEIASNVIEDLTGLPGKNRDNAPDFTSMPEEEKKQYFIQRLKDMSRTYMRKLPKEALTTDEWLVLLHKLEKLEEKIKESFTKFTFSPKYPATQLSEAEVIAAKGLSKIIDKINARVAIKLTQEPASKKEETTETKETEEEKKSKNEALLAKCEVILTSKGEKSLLDSFYTIKSYITQGLPVPKTYKKHVISICSSIDAKLLEDDIQEALKLEDEEREKSSLSVIGSQNPELLAKYSAQALRNAKQTLNAVAFRNMMSNGQTKSESDACDTPFTDCKWTHDCICCSCKDIETAALAEMKQCCDESKSKSGLEEKKKEVKSKPPVKPKPQPKVCENASHQQHVCKVGHSNGTNACAGDGAADQPCTCCYCTVFGHAPPLTTPVPRNFNETRERLRSILNKKKQKCKTANGEPDPASLKPAPAPKAAPAQPDQPRPKPVPAPPAPKPPFVFQALPKSLPPATSPALTAAQMQAQLRRQAEQRQLTDKMADKVADKMADMTVSDKDKPKALQRTVPVQVSVPPALKAEGKVNPNAMEQIRLQQLKQQQQAQFQTRPPQQPAPAPAPAQKKPEPIYDLPIHNKPALTPQQQQQIRQQQLQQQQQQQQLLQQLQQKRMSRPAQTRGHGSLSSRDTSVFSTSSGCSGITSHSGSCWRGAGSHQDPRDLDALLQYIEGPSRHVDRGKKRAKKQRQKGKRMECRLLEEHGVVSTQLLRVRAELRVVQARHANHVRQCEETKAMLRQQQNLKKGKKGKLSAAQMAKAQLLAERLGELNNLVNITTKEVAAEEKRVEEYSERLLECERQLLAARALQGEPARAAPVPSAAPSASLSARKHLENAALLHRQHLQQQNMHQQLQQQALDLSTSDKMDRQKQQAFINAHGVRRAVPPPVTVMHNGRQLTVLNARVGPAAPAPAPVVEPPRKQTWEQALAHINQLAKGQAKEKKKSKEIEKQEKLERQEKLEKIEKQEKAAKVEPKHKEPQRSQSLPDSQPLSKKQRKLLAKQQAEEEERKRLQQLQKQEAKSKKEKEKKVEPPKVEPKRVEKRETKKTEPVKEEKGKKKEKKKEEKKEEKKGKEKKQEKTIPAPAPAQPKQKPKKEKKEQKPQVINITADTTIEVVSKKGCSSSPENPSSCSIMEQLSCGVQVSDLRLPPGITLTRVQPSEKKEPAPIRSVPLWKAGALAAAPTPVARPAPVINADPGHMMFSTAQPEPPKTIIIPEPAPPAPGRSKKAKKKAKKAAAAADAEPKPEGTKMVTLRNPMFHPNLPPASNPVKKPEIRIPDPIPMPPNACQATITPTSNGMYTIRNPLMSIMHQQSLMGMNQPQMPMYGQQYNYVNPNTYPTQPAPNPQAYVLDPSRNSPKQDEFQNRIMNLASFTQKNEEGYSLFKTNEDNQQRNFLAPEYYVENSNPKPVVSPNPIGTRPTNDSNRSFDSNDSSLFTNPVRPEPIGTPMKQENDYAGLYTPFGQEDRNVFRNALFNDNNVPSYGKYDDGNHVVNGDALPYFQRLRVGSKLNNEVTIHHVTESKFYKGQEIPMGDRDESLFARAWPTGYRDPTNKPVSRSVEPKPTESSIFHSQESSNDNGGTLPRHNPYWTQVTPAYKPS